MKAIHLLSKREGKGRHGLKKLDARQGLYASRCWVIPDQEVESLIGGWVYLHQSKSVRSAMGGRVEKILEGSDDCAGKKIIHFMNRAEGREVRWRGADHDMSINGGVIDADLPHEKA